MHKFIACEISSTEEEMIQLGHQFAKNLKKNDVVALHGDLGAGKTTFIKGIIKELTGISQREIPSPTFTYLSIYETEFSIYHFDLYRLQNKEAFIEMGFLDYFEEGLCLIEWANRISSYLPKKTIHIQFDILEENRRQIHVQRS